jgi:hypothetical protein
MRHVLAPKNLAEAEVAAGVGAGTIVTSLATLYHTYYYLV